LRRVLSRKIERNWASRVKWRNKAIAPYGLILDRLASVLKISVSDIVAASSGRDPLPKNLPRGRHATRARRKRKKLRGR
jgi:hypothetical protein